MPAFNPKSLIRGLSFINLRFYFRLMLDLRVRRNRTFFLFEGRNYTYGETYRRSMEYARFFLSMRKKLVTAGELSGQERLAIGIYQENRPEFLFAVFGAAISNSVVFALNTGFRGKTLAEIARQANLSILLIDGSTAPEIQKTLPALEAPCRSHVFLAEDRPGQAGGYAPLSPAVLKAQRDRVAGYRLPIDNTSTFLVIYTSGVTGLPKGVPCSQVKLWGAGALTELRIRLRRSDRGYVCMPLFHSNAWYIGIMPLMLVGGSFVLKRKFSASAFEADMLHHGVTYMNYVGQPLHYILTALEKKYGSTEALEQALARHPDNRFRLAHGNGASVVDRTKLIRALGMEHIYELYGSTEAAITTTNRPGDPIESVGAVSDKVVILDPSGRRCQPGRVDPRGRLLNYEEAVGEICRKIGKDNVFFDGYYGNAQATAQKYRNGYYHSGDLGHIREIHGKRYLYFNGRTDDWIRKDGENFSADSVLQYARLMPGVEHAIAYGVPCEVADELVMVALQMHKDARFDPRQAFDWFTAQQRDGGMDPKWMPDYIRLVGAFPLTGTQKVAVGPFKRQHFNLRRDPDMEVYCRRRGDREYLPLGMDRFQQIEQAFAQTGRTELLFR